MSSTPVRRVEKESLLDALAELQEENAGCTLLYRCVTITLPFTEFWKCPLERVLLTRNHVVRLQESRRPLTSVALVSLAVWCTTRIVANPKDA